MRQTAGFGVLLVSVMLATVGCSAPPSPEPGPVAIYPTPDYGMDALLVGTLHLVDGCVLVDRGAIAPAVPVFPSEDVTWDEEGGLLTWKGETYRDGDEISLGGGLSDATGIEGAYLPDPCEGHETFLVSPI